MIPAPSLPAYLCSYRKKEGILKPTILAVNSMTPLTLFLAEASSTLWADPNVLIYSRGPDIVLGSVIGAVGGWFVHHEQLHKSAERQFRKTRVALLRK